jgi:hypothetical protein
MPCQVWPEAPPPSGERGYLLGLPIEDVTCNDDDDEATAQPDVTFEDLDLRWRPL